MRGTKIVTGPIFAWTSSALNRNVSEMSNVTKMAVSDVIVGAASSDPTSADRTMNVPTRNKFARTSSV